MDIANDIVPESLPNSNRPRALGRTKFQAVLLAEVTWLQNHLIPTDIYICPSEATRSGSKGAI